MEEIRIAAEIIKRQLDAGLIEPREAIHEFLNLEQLIEFAEFSQREER